jgi:hypothetical protein
MVGASYDNSVYWVPIMNRDEYYNPEWHEFLKKAIIILNIVMILRHANVLQGIYNIAKEIESLKPEIQNDRTIPRIAYDKFFEVVGSFGAWLAKLPKLVGQVHD